MRAANNAAASSKKDIPIWQAKWDTDSLTAVKIMKAIFLMFWLVFFASSSLAQGLSGTIDIRLTIVSSCQVKSSNQNVDTTHDSKANYPAIQCHKGGGLVTEPKISHTFIAPDGMLLSKNSTRQMAQLITVEW
ncbi:hypothetical protein ACTZGB_18225 [Yersinia bercovieri]|nr:hypothetical protein [Yersinia bercovieri]MDN0102857.1 hypothetical protein [Yersinia bercovieri]QKJ05445.1 hypothetical protein HRK25_10045 [Yersinia bercovieri ATCC 43970]